MERLYKDGRVAVEAMTQKTPPILDESSKNEKLSVTSPSMR